MMLKRSGARRLSLPQLDCCTIGIGLVGTSSLSIMFETTVVRWGNHSLVTWLAPFRRHNTLEKRLDRQPCCAGILYECMRLLIGHSEINATEEFLSPRCLRTERR